MSESVIDINKIMEYLPHRYPMLLVDRIEEADGDDNAVGIKNVTANEPIFQGHFPGKPIFPGVLIVEAMAQTAGALVVHNMGDEALDKLVFFMAIDNCKFRKPVIPGDQMRIHVEKEKARGTVWRYACKAYVGDKVCAEAIVTAMIADKD